MTKRVLILYAGGTIGMEQTAQGYSPMADFPARLMECLTAQPLAQMPDYDVITLPQPIDSSNLIPQDWTNISRVLIQQWERFDGFVVLHGTDTMAYSASALSFLLRGNDKPVIFTGSQIPLTVPRTDALSNVLSSLQLAAFHQVNEVGIAFSDRLLRGNRSRKMCSSHFTAFDSPNYAPLAAIGINIQIDTTRLLTPAAPQFTQPTFVAEDVILLPMYPGISAVQVDAMLNATDVKGVILQSYGAGNPPDANHALMARFEKASADGIVIVNTTQCPYGSVQQGAYATGSALNRIGVVPGSDLTPEAAFAKLHYLFHHCETTSAVREQMMRSLCGELTETV